MQCVLLAAGEGTRMRPLTANRPKVMLPVAGKPLLQHLLERAIAAGFHDFTFVTHYQAATIRAHFGNGRRWNARIRYVDQGKASGTGHAVAALHGKVKGPFALVYGDALLGVEDLRRLATTDGLAIGAHKVKDASPYGLLEVRGNRLRAIREKPKRAGPGLVNVGAYVLSTDVVDEARRLRKSPRGEFELTDAVTARAREEHVRVLRCASWLDVGRPWDLLTAQAELLEAQEPRVDGKVDSSAVLDGNVVVEDGAHVRHGTVIEGPCLVQAGARVGPHAYLRGATTIGPSCHVGAHVEIKNSLLMESTNVPHLSYVGDSILGARVNFGAGTMVANLKHSDHTVRVRMADGSWVDTGRRKFGVIVGDDVKTGINSTLNVGAVLEAGVRVLPGRIVEGWIPGGATFS